MADQIEVLFKEADTNKNGIISLTELGQMFKSLGMKLTAQDLRNILCKFDKEGSNGINLDQFRELIAEVFQANTEYEEAYEAFKYFDKNGDNVITADEVREACKGLDKEPSPEEIDYLIKAMDENGDGVITFDEFAKAYACGL